MNKPHSFRKKPVVIEAVQFVGHNYAAIAAFTDGAARYSSTRCGDVETNCCLIIPTLEGDHKANVGDWIIKGVNGEFYPCKPDIFAKTYDAAEVGEGMSFGQALEAIKAGKRIARTGWNGKGMFVYLVPPASYAVQTGAATDYFGAGSMVPYNAYMAIKNADGTVSTWVPSVNDCLADDWFDVCVKTLCACNPPLQDCALHELKCSVDATTPEENTEEQDWQ